MKKTSILCCAFAMMLSGCGFTGGTATGSTSDILGAILGTATSGDAVSNIIYDVIGATKITQENIIGTWKYSGPGCAFTSENLLAKAGGELVAAQVEEKLLPTYNKLGISSSNTYFTFNNDGTFSAKIDGKNVSGNYTYDASNCSIQLQTLLLSTTGYIARNSKGISLLFESKKLLTALQVVGAASGNSTLSTVGDISKNYDGIRLGFDLSK